MAGIVFRGRPSACLLLAAAALLGAPPARAQPYAVPPTWGGDLLDRPRLTGDWNGVRDDLGKKGVVLDIDLMASPQQNTTGGRETGGATWANADYTLNFDTEKMGYWRGGFIKIQGETGFGNNIFGQTGAIVPVNTAAILPETNNPTSALMNFTVTQFLSTKFGVMAGKINLLDAGFTEFYGDYRTQFQNTMFAFPMTLEQVPISSFGGGIIVIPREDILLTATVVGPEGSPVDNDVGAAFDGVMLIASGKLTWKPWGLTGHQAMNFTWNNKDRFALDQDPANLATLLLQEKFPRLANPGPVLAGLVGPAFPGLLVPAQPANRKSSSWAITYTFDQYFWQPADKPKEGVGVFFAFGASDGNPNPIQYAFLGGVGGKGVVPGRPDDSFGLGFASTQFSDTFVPLLRQRLDLGLRTENAFEAYYNVAATGWLNVTGDLQVVSPGLQKALTGTGQLKSVDTAVIVGLRFRARL